MNKSRLWLILLLFCLPMAIKAQIPTSLSGDAALFWKKFQGAVLRDDRDAVAAMTRYPFLYPNEIDRAAFLKSYDKIFPLKTKNCFRAAKPQPDEGFFTVLCGGNAYLFGQNQGSYDFFSIESRD